MSDKPIIIIIRESVVSSIIKDVSSLALVAALISLGVYLGSTAMQWFGFLCACLAFVSLAGRFGDKKSELTVDEARKRLDEI